MSKKRKFIFITLAVFILIQFIRPAKNSGNIDTENSIPASAEVKNILQTSCNDCHSNYTVYPWYSNVQPIGWWLDHHVNEGKEELNFSEFGTYDLKRKLHKLKEIKKEIEKDKMPISSYTLTHREAKLSNEQKQVLLKWVEDIKYSLKDSIQ